MIIKHTTTNDIPALRQLWKQAFGDEDSFLDAFFSLGYAPERSLCAREDGKPVAALYWFDQQWRDRTVAYVYGVATEQSYQNRGICSKLMKRLERLLKERGYYGIILVPREPGLVAFYERLGYVVATTLCHYRLPAAGDPDPEFRQIPWEKYAFYRQQFLPEESVLPGAEMYQLLETYQGFYRCSAGIFCGAAEETPEGRILRVQEFLGEPRGAFTAITAMGCKGAILRLRGGAPFGLFRCLTKEKEMPKYIGLVMD